MQPDRLISLLNSAEQQLSLGALGEAEALYREILNQIPGQPRASHGLGLIALHTGHAAAAVELLQTASLGAESDPAVHCHLALAMATTGDHANAEACYRKSLSLAPDFVDSRINLANLMLETGRLDGAEAEYRAALDLSPDSAAAHYGTGMLALKRKRSDDAITAFERAVELAPQLLPARINLANLLLLSRRHEEAVRHLEEAVAYAPDSFDVRLNLCAALQQVDRTSEAVEVARAALAMAPDSPELLLNLGSAEMSDGRPEDAWRTLDRALGMAPDYAPAKLNRAMARLLLGDFEGGWDDYESRPSRGVLPHPGIAEIAEWRGEDLTGKTVLVWAEQGYGDVLQFSRYLPLLSARGARVCFDVPPPLARLFESFAGIDSLVVRDRDTDLPDADFQIPILSVPHRFATTLGTIPAEIPYIDLPPGPSRTGDDDRTVTVGLCWKGSTSNPNDHRRSVDPESLQQALERPNIRLLGLQYGEDYAPFENPGSKVADFRELAGLIAPLDLVVSVDTSVAHLAGAMGKPVWLLLAHAPDWRWMTDRDDSPWYPTMRLFRQPRPGDWESVFGAIRKALDESL